MRLAALPVLLTLAFLVVPLPLSSQETGLRFEVEDLDGNPDALVPGSGRILVVNWWATWCAPCRVEIPELNMIVEKWKDHPDVAFVAVAQEDAATVRAFLDENEFHFEQFVATAQSEALLGRNFPRNVVFDREGRVAFDAKGYRPTNVYKIAAKLRELAPLGGSVRPESPDARRD